ncbi:MAG: hypothetical protein ACI33P_04370 [Lysinibacillus sp.]
MRQGRMGQMIIVLLSASVLFGCSSNEMINIEDSNTYAWQKYMNEKEFDQLKEGMTYMEVVEIARGPGEMVDDHTYVWPDELIITQAYEVEFKDDRLVDKRIIEKRGESTRDLPKEEQSGDDQKAEDEK